LQNSYKDSGVDIEAGEKTVDNIKDVVKSTFNKNVITGLGHFGAFYELDLEGYTNPVMVSSVDGVGTKLKVAIDSGINNSVGQDLVNHCVNDIAVCGAKPLYFMDYMAFGKLDTAVATDIVKGFAIACKENGVALIGGETAEMPGLYQEKDYDLSGTIVGIVDKNNIINGETITQGDILVGFKSNGLHTNGYSLARNVLLSKYKLDDKISDLGSDLKTELLKVHKSYLSLIQKLISTISIKGFSHITGGGIIGNTKRIIPENLKIELDWNAWKLPSIFKLIQETGKISDDEMRKVFNMGIGLIAVIDKNDLENVIKVSKQLNEEVYLLGKIV
jgi:phosphoribosylformylglycinamidine cyclo-ligase